MSNKATVTLLAHREATAATRAQVNAVKAPRAIGPYHKPVSHGELLSTLERQLKTSLNATVESESYALRRGGAGLFGVLTLSYGETKEMTAALGLRHANDMSMSLQLVAGLTVFVCDNMVLRGDMIVLKKRHTLNLALAGEEVAAAA